MPSLKGTPPQIYIPTLHKELIGHWLPESVLFMDPGLPQTASLPGQYHPQTFPFPRDKAAKVLQELLAIGESLGAEVSPVSRAVQDKLTASHSLSPEEEETLLRFSSTHKSTLLHARRESDLPTIAAQKVLLLAWNLEEHRKEITALHHEVIEASVPLHQAICGLDPDPSLSPVLKDGDPDPFFSGKNYVDLNSMELPEADWRLTLAAIAEFLPNNAVLVSAHKGIREALNDIGLLHSMSQEIFQRFSNWPKDMESRLLWAKCPLWRLVGRRKAPATGSRLLFSPEIILCPEMG